MRPNFFALLCLLFCLTGLTSDLFAGLPLATEPQEDKTTAATEGTETPPAIDPLEEHRKRFSDKDADAGMLAISADKLIKGGKADWLRGQLNNNALSDIGLQAIISAFISNKDLSAIPEILPLTLDPDRPGVSKSAQKAIALFLDDPVTRSPFIEQLIGFCSAGSESLLLPSVQALGQACDLSAIPVLIPLVNHSNAEIKQKAVQTLHQLTYRDFKNDENAWKGWWEKNRHLSRDRLIEPELIGRIEQLSQKVNNLTNQRIDLAMQLIEHNPEKAVDFLGWDVKAVQIKAAQVIHAGPPGEETQEVLAKVIKFLERPKIPEDTLKLLLQWVGRTKGKPQGAQKIMLHYLRKGADDAIKAVAARSLHGFDNPAVRKAVVEDLESMKVEANRDELKECLLELLAELGCGDNLDLVIHFLNPTESNSKGVRQEAARALGESKKPRAIEVLTHSLTAEPENEIRSEIASSLLKLGRLGNAENKMMELAVEGLKRGLLDRESRVKIVCINGIGELKPPNGLEILREHLLRSEDDTSVRRWYIKAVGSVGDAGGLEVICNALPANSKGDEANVALFEESQRAVGNICGDDLALWAQAIEIFFTGGQFDLTIGFCDNYLTRVKGKNGDDETLKRIKIVRAESCYRHFMLEGDHVKASESAKMLSEQLAPDDVIYIRLYARSLAALGKQQEAVDLYAKVIARLVNEPDATVSLWRSRLEAAHCHLALGNVEWVRKCFEGLPATTLEGLPADLQQGLNELRSRIAVPEKPPVKHTPAEKPVEPKPDAPAENASGKQAGAETKADPDKKTEGTAAQEPKPEKPDPEKKDGEQPGINEKPSTQTPPTTGGENQA